MTSRYYSTTAVATTLLADITNVATSCSVGSITGMPTSFPFSLTLEPNTANVEVVDVTAVSGTGPYTLTIARGKDGTSGQVHHLGDPVKHLITARDLLDLAQQMQVDAASGLVVPAFQTAFRNGLINGQFAVSQKGTTGVGSQGLTTTLYRAGPDCWNAFRGAATAGMTWTQLTTADTLPSGFSNGLRVARDSGNTSTQGCWLSQAIETKDATRFQGRPACLTFWARKGAGYTSASSVLYVSMNSGTGTDQNYTNVAYTGSVTEIATTVTLTTSWQKFYIAGGTYASTLTEMNLNFYFTPVGTAGANDYFDITGVQFEDGDYPSPFEFRPYQVELALCQRRFYRLVDSVSSVDFLSYYAVAGSLRWNFPTPVPMRGTYSTIAVGTNITTYASGTNPTTSVQYGIYQNGSWSTGTHSSISGSTVTAGSNARVIMTVTGSSLVVNPALMVLGPGAYIDLISDL